MQLLLNDPRETYTRDLVNRLMNEETKKSKTYTRDLVNRLMNEETKKSTDLP